MEYCGAQKMCAMARQSADNYWKATFSSAIRALFPKMIRIFATRFLSALQAGYSINVGNILVE
jgi:hypothetical protein